MIKLLTQLSQRLQHLLFKLSPGVCGISWSVIQLLLSELLEQRVEHSRFRCYPRDHISKVQIVLSIGLCGITYERVSGADVEINVGKWLDLFNFFDLRDEFEEQSKPTNLDGF